MPRALPVTFGQRARGRGRPAYPIRRAVGRRGPGSDSICQRASPPQPGKGCRAGQASSGPPAVGFSMGSGVSYSYGRNLAGDLKEFHVSKPQKRRRSQNRSQIQALQPFHYQLYAKIIAAKSPTADWITRVFERITDTKNEPYYGLTPFILLWGRRPPGRSPCSRKRSSPACPRR